MNQTLDLPICGLDDSLPDQLFLLHHPSSAKYGCYCHDGIHGLAAFSTEVGAFRFAEYIDLSGMSIEEMSFDEAREVAKQRPLPVVSLMLLDRMDDPKIHFVR
ncbi:MAG TPA: hypothetical protein VGL56_01390 [Fimbriimonadaceae bacterium]|jgi:hypothetical protein